MIASILEILDRMAGGILVGLAVLAACGLFIPAFGVVDRISAYLIRRFWQIFIIIIFILVVSFGMLIIGQSVIYPLYYIDDIYNDGKRYWQETPTPPRLTYIIVSIYGFLLSLGIPPFLSKLYTALANLAALFGMIESCRKLCKTMKRCFRKWAG